MYSTEEDGIMKFPFVQYWTTRVLRQKDVVQTEIFYMLYLFEFSCLRLLKNQFATMIDEIRLAFSYELE